MKRRDFVSLAALAGLPRAATARQDARWRFALDARGRWSVSRGGVTPIQGAEISVQLAGEPPFALGTLDNARRLRTRSRRSGESSWTLVGRRSGVEFSAQFEDDEYPDITVRARGLEDRRDLIAVHFTGGVSLPQRYAWINGYHSRGACRMVDLTVGESTTGFWQLALLGGQGRQGRQADSLAFAFGEEDGASGEFRINARTLDAVAVFRHRAISVDHGPASCSLAILPGGDPFAALGADAARRIARTRSTVTPTGWTFRHEASASVSEADVLANLAAAQRAFDPRAFRVIQVDDGFQRAAGDWETNGRFPHGHRWLTDRIHASGFEAGLWLAPFAVTSASGIPAIHPEWLLLGDDGRPLPLDGRPHWGGRAYALDASQREVQDWLRELARHAVRAWGYGVLKLDFLHFGAQGGRPGRGASGHEALRAGLRALREGAGRAFVHACGAPLQHALGLVDGMRIGADLETSWGGIQAGARAALMRSHLHITAWRNDPDALLVQEPLTLDEARAWASVVALTGQMAFAEGRLERLSEARIELLQRVMPAAGVRGRALDLTTARPSQLLARARDDWWTLALVNWDDGPARMTADLAAAGVNGPLAAFDVWAERRLADVSGRLSVPVAPHSAAVVGLRRPRRVPFVLGSSRHLVQGAVDIWSEQWDARQRRLTGRSVLLDGRPYALTIALPSGFRPRQCTANVTCRAGEVVQRAVTIEFAGSREDIEWSVDFQ